MHSLSRVRGAASKASGSNKIEEAHNSGFDTGILHSMCNLTLTQDLTRDDEAALLTSADLTSLQEQLEHIQPDPSTLYMWH